MIWSVSVLECECVLSWSVCELECGCECELECGCECELECVCVEPNQPSQYCGKTDRLHECLADLYFAYV